MFFIVNAKKEKASCVQCAETQTFPNKIILLDSTERRDDVSRKIAKLWFPADVELYVEAAKTIHYEHSR